MRFGEHPHALPKRDQWHRLNPSRAPNIRYSLAVGPVLMVITSFATNSRPVGLKTRQPLPVAICFPRRRFAIIGPLRAAAGPRFAQLTRPDPRPRFRGRCGHFPVRPFDCHASERCYRRIQDLGPKAVPY